VEGQSGNPTRGSQSRILARSRFEQVKIDQSFSDPGRMRVRSRLLGSFDS
jgi:hypothetical protein